MADMLIRCPACDHELRLPPEFVGKMVECPQCSTRFMSPAPVAGPPPAVRAVTDRIVDGEVQRSRTYEAAISLRAPATILLIFAGINLLLSGWGVLTARAVVGDPDAFEVQMHQEIDRQPNIRGEQRDQMRDWFSARFIRDWSTHILSCPGVLAACSFLVILGCIQMLRLRSYGFCVLASVMSITPLVLPCCFLMAPFGIWALIVLLNADVRRAFA